MLVAKDNGFCLRVLAHAAMPVEMIAHDIGQYRDRRTFFLHRKIHELKTGKLKYHKIVFFDLRQNPEYRAADIAAVMHT